jgi:hypothetical protein
VLIFFTGDNITLRGSQFINLMCNFIFTPEMLTKVKEVLKTDNNNSKSLLLA